MQIMSCLQFKITRYNTYNAICFHFKLFNKRRRMTSEEGHRIHKYTHQNIFKGVKFYIFMQNRLGTYSFSGVNIFLKKMHKNGSLETFFVKSFQSTRCSLNCDSFKDGKYLFTKVSPEAYSNFVIGSVQHACITALKHIKREYSTLRNRIIIRFMENMSLSNIVSFNFYIYLQL